MNLRHVVPIWIAQRVTASRKACVLHDLALRAKAKPNCATAVLGASAALFLNMVMLTNLASHIHGDAAHEERRHHSHKADEHQYGSRPSLFAAACRSSEELYDRKRSERPIFLSDVSQLRQLCACQSNEEEERKEDEGTQLLPPLV